MDSEADETDRAGKDLCFGQDRHVICSRKGLGQNSCISGFGKILRRQYFFKILPIFHAGFC